MFKHGQKRSRPAVVCLHGSGGSAGQWHSLQQHLGERCEVLAPHLVGYGGQRFRARRRLRLDDEIGTLLRQIGRDSGPFHVVGHSYGGTIAIYLAERHPELVKSLVLYEPANIALLYSEGLDTPEAQDMRRLQQRATGTGTLANWRAAREIVKFWQPRGAWSAMSLAQRSRLAGLMPKISAEYDAMLGAYDELTDLAGLEVPVRLVAGTQSPRASLRISELLREQISDCQLLRIAGCGHMAPVTQSYKVNAVLTDYLLPPADLPAGISRRQRAG